MNGLLSNAWRYWRSDRRLALPLQVGFAANNTCNTFCEMCNIWRLRPKEALTLGEIENVFGGPLFGHCATVSITGGEPTMRRDFAELPSTLARIMPAVRQINLTSNGYDTERTLASFESFLPLLRKRGVGFSVNLSIDGVGEIHNRVRNRPDAWARLDATIRALQELKRRLPFNLVLACTFTHSNVDDAENVLDYARKTGVYVIFRKATFIDRLENRHAYDDFAPSAEQLKTLERFFRRLVEYDRSHARVLYYRMLLRMMGGSARDVPCLYRKAGLFVDHQGDMYVCTVFSRRLGNALEGDPLDIYGRSVAHREELAGDACRRCSHDVTLYTPVAHQAYDRIKSKITGVHR